MWPTPTQVQSSVGQQLAFENANKACRQASLPRRRKASLHGTIRIGSDAGPAHVQGVAFAAALKEAFHDTEKKSAGCVDRGSQRAALFRTVDKKEVQEDEDTSKELCLPGYAHVVRGVGTGLMNVSPHLLSMDHRYSHREPSPGATPGPVKPRGQLLLQTQRDRQSSHKSFFRATPGSASVPPSNSHSHQKPVLKPFLQEFTERFLQVQGA